MANSKSVAPYDVFQDLDFDQMDVNAVVSLCFNCGKNGKLLLTRIPFYKELVISSFECPHCDFKYDQLDPAIEIKTNGVRITLDIRNKDDLDRLVITSDYTSIKIFELDFEIPPMSQRSQVTTVEGIISKSISNLSNQNSKQTAEMAQKMDVLIEALHGIKTLTYPVTMVFEDATGNLVVSNPISNLIENDPRKKTIRFTRNSEQNKMIGLSEEGNAEYIMRPLGSFNNTAVNNVTDEIVQFSGPCPNCNADCETNMKVTDIPYFKQVVIMATNCEECGYRINEVKPGGSIEKQGVKITVRVSSPEDLNRNILKSETCSLLIPEIDFEVGALSLSGRFTTIEGLLTSLYDQVKDTATVFYSGDSQSRNVLTKTEKILSKLNKIKACEMPVDVTLVDPTGNSYVQTLTPPDLDPKLSITKFERSFEQNEELGLNDINVDGYE